MGTTSTCSICSTVSSGIISISKLSVNNSQKWYPTKRTKTIANGKVKYVLYCSGKDLISIKEKATKLENVNAIKCWIPILAKKVSEKTETNPSSNGTAERNTKIAKMVEIIQIDKQRLRDLGLTYCDFLIMSFIESKSRINELKKIKCHQTSKVSSAIGIIPWSDMI